MKTRMKRSLFSILFVTAALCPLRLSAQLDQIWTYFFDLSLDDFHATIDRLPQNSEFTIEALIFPWRKGINENVDDDNLDIHYSNADDRVQSLGWFNLAGEAGISGGLKQNSSNQWVPWIKGRFTRLGTERSGEATGSVAITNIWGRWLHQAVTYTPGDGGTIRMFVNGQEVDEFNDIGTIDALSDDFAVHVGTEYHQRRTAKFNGFIREARMWSTALDSATIRHYMQTVPDENHPDEENLIFRAPLYWESEDGTTNKNDGRWEAVNNRTMSTHGDVDNQYGSVQVLAYWDLVGDSFRNFLDPSNVRATGGRSRLALTDDTPEEYQTTVRWDWRESWGPPSRFKIYRALKADQGDLQSFEPEGDFEAVGTVSGDDLVFRERDNPLDQQLRYVDNPPDGKIYLYTVHSDYGQGAMLEGQRSHTHLTSGRAYMPPDSATSLTVSTDNPLGIELDWTPPEYHQQDPPPFYLPYMSEMPGGSRSSGGISGRAAIDVRIPYTADLNLEQYSVDFWFWPEPGRTNPVMLVSASKNRSEANYRTFFEFSMDRFGGLSYRFHEHGATTWNITHISTGSDAVRYRQWNHVAAVHDGETATLYLNGVAVGTLTDVSLMEFDSGLIWVGGDHDNPRNPRNFFVGMVDEFRIWSAAVDFSYEEESTDRLHAGHRHWLPFDPEMDEQIVAWYGMNIDEDNPRVVRELSGRSVDGYYWNTIDPIVGAPNAPVYNNGDQPLTAGSQSGLIQNGEAGQPYHVTFYSHNNYGPSAWPITGQGLSPGPTPPPENVVAVQNTNGTVDVSWDLPGGEERIESFTVFRGETEMTTVTDNTARSVQLENDPACPVCEPLPYKVKTVATGDYEIVSTNASLTFDEEEGLRGQLRNDLIPHGSQGWSISFWAKVQSAHDGWLLDSSRPGIPTVMRLAVPWSDGQVKWQVGYVSSGVSRVRELSYELPEDHDFDTWSHWVFVFRDGEQNRRSVIYLNGEQVAITRYSFSFPRQLNTPSLMTIGSGADGNNPFQGMVDGLHIWERALTAEEAGDLYGTANRLTESLEEDLLAAYPFDGKDPNILTDVSGNSRHARLIRGSDNSYHDLFQDSEGSRYIGNILTPGHAIKQPRLRQDLAASELSVSQGEYTDRVVMRWHEAFSRVSDRLVVSRRPLGAGGSDWQEVFTNTEVTNTLFEDIFGGNNELELGAIYQYQLDLFKTCEGFDPQQVTFNQFEDEDLFGYADPTGEVSGRITQYDSDIAIEDVMLTALPQGAPYQVGYAFRFDGEERHVETPVNIGQMSPVTLEAWIKPARLDHEESQDIMSAAGGGAKGLRIKDGTAELQVGVGGNDGFWDTGIQLDSDEWQHVAVIYGEDSIQVIHGRGDEVETVEHDGGVESSSSSQTLELGRGDNGYHWEGLMDEVRVWDVARTEEEVLRDRGRYLNGNEEGLVLYYNFDVQGLPRIFDRSWYTDEEGVKVMRMGHGAATVEEEGDPFVTNEGANTGNLPHQNVLTNIGYTNENGEYTISGIAYEAVSGGHPFNITPNKGTLNFRPGRQSLTLSGGRHTFGNVGFANDAITVVQGTITYPGEIPGRLATSVETIPAEGIEIHVGSDTNSIGPLSPPVRTNARGRYTVTVSNGRTIIQPIKPFHSFLYDMNGETFSDGYEPRMWHDFEAYRGNTDQGRYTGRIVGVNLLGEVSGTVDFVDEMQFLVRGRVVGGWREEEKVHGTHVNNIGRATLTFTSQDQKVVVQRETDPETGAYSALLPPKVYNVSVEIPSDLTLFADEPARSLDLTEDLEMQTIRDTVVTGADLIADISAIDTEIRLTDVSPFVLEEEDALDTPTIFLLVDSEEMAVLEVDADNNSVTVIRGANETHAESHAAGANVNRIDEWQYNAYFPIIWNPPPVLNVVQADESPLPTSDAHRDKNGNAMTRTYYSDDNVETFAYDDAPWPVFETNRSYRLRIRAHQVFTNKDGDEDVVDEVSLKEGTLLIQNDLAYPNFAVGGYPDESTGFEIVLQHGEVTDDQGNTVEYQLGDTLYTFVAGYANPTAEPDDSPVPDKSHTGIINITLTARGVEEEVMWYPNDKYDTDIQQDYEKAFRAIVTGIVPIEGEETVVSGPDELMMVIRDPPGSHSFATWEEGSTTCRSTTETWSDGVSTDLALGYSWGTEIIAGYYAGGIGFGAFAGTTVFETEYEVVVSHQFHQDESEFEQLVDCISTTRSISTSGHLLGGLVGETGDIFLGASKAYRLGSGREVFLDDDGRPDVADGLTMSMDGINTTFAYTHGHIVEHVIPSYIQMRNQLLTAENDYTSNFGSAEDSTEYCDSGDCTEFEKRYGSNNDDPIWGDDVTSTTPRVPDAADFDGESYTLSREEDEDGIDSLRFFNEQIRLWRHYISQNHILKSTAREIKNVSFSSGVTYEESRSIDTTSTEETAFEIQHGVGGGMDLDFRTGIELDFGFKMTRSEGEKTNNTVQNGSTFSYTLEDEDDGDEYTVTIAEDRQYGSFVFRTVSGTSSCPNEGELSFVDDNGREVVINQPTLKIHSPTLAVSPTERLFVPYEEPAIFELTLGNASENNTTQTYRLRVNHATNPYGATVRVNGESVADGLDLELGAAEQRRAILTIDRPVVADNTGDNLIEILFGPECDPLLDQSIYVRATWQPVCSDVSVFAPADRWAVNLTNRSIVDGTNRDTLQVVIDNYDLQMAQLEWVELQYRGISDQDWNQIARFLRTEPNVDYTGQDTIPTDVPYIQYTWDVSGLGDRIYEVRAVTHCGGTNNTFSEINTGIIDRIEPVNFGFPGPEDLVMLGPEDDITVTFNEPIDGGGLGTGNFEFRSEVNKLNLTHDASLSFGGSTSDYIDLGSYITLANKSFTIEFWAQRLRGSTAEVVFSHGTSSNGLEIGFDADNYFYCSYSGNTVKSTSAYSMDDSDNTGWHHWAVSFNASGDTKTLTLVRDGEVAGSNVSLSSNYTGAGAAYIGKSVSNDKAFKGMSHEVRIWDRVKAYTDIGADKSSTFGGREKGLIGYWRLDDAHGTYAEDRARDHHGKIYGASWRIYPQGYAVNQITDSNGNVQFFLFPSPAAALDAALQSAYDNVVNKLSGLSHLTMEAWVKFESAADRAVVALPEGPGLFIDTNNKVRFSNKGATALSSMPVADLTVSTGEWVHVAVTSDTSTLKFYINGQLAGTDRSNAAFTVPNAAVYVGVTDCKVDEVRIWNTVRTSRQIKRDYVHHLKGDEAGLIVYLPFERYSDADVSIVRSLYDHGIKYTTSGVIEQLAQVPGTFYVGTPASGGIDYVDLAGTLTLAASSATYYSDMAASVKAARERGTMLVDFWWNESQIHILPQGRANAQMELNLMDVTVQNVKDLNGNLMAAPINFHAYFDRNPVQWYTPDVDVAKYLDESLSEDNTDTLNQPLKFTAIIGNRGGKSETFTITGMPDWLTVDEATGTIPANATYGNNRAKTVTFTVNRNLNPGVYKESIALESSFGFAHQLPVTVRILRKPPTWTNPANMSHSMTIVGRLSIDSEPSNDPYDRVGAFVGSTLRGWAPLEYKKELDEYQFFLTVYSNSSSGESVKLKVWNASAGRLHPSVTPTYTFTANARHGSTVSPEAVSATKDVVQFFDIASGANWKSINISASDMTANTLFTSDLTVIDSIVTSSATHTKTSGSFSSTLTLDNTSMVKIYGNATKEYELEGTALTPSTVSISPSNGWNWIGYTPNFNLEVNEALANFVPADGDVIKSYAQFAEYQTSTGWVGNLEAMRPGEGYMLYTSQSSPSSFTYPDAGIYFPSPAVVLAGRAPRRDNSPRWKEERTYRHSMLLVASVDMNGVSMSTRDKLAVFVDDEVRGVARPVQVGQKLLYFVVAHSDRREGEMLQFRVYSAEDGNTKDLAETIPFQADARMGTSVEPITLTRTALGIGDEGYIPDEFMLSQNYPNPFNPYTTIGFGIPEVSQVTLSVYDILGRRVRTLADDSFEPGYRRIIWDGRDDVGNFLSAGIYFVEMRAGSFRNVKKVVLLK